MGKHATINCDLCKKGIRLDRFGKHRDSRKCKPLELRMTCPNECG